MRAAEMPLEIRYSRTVFGAAGAERKIVFARAALVGMAFDGEGIVVVAVEPLRLLVERRARLIGQIRGIGVEEDAIADIDGEILLAAGRCIRPFSAD